MRCSNGTGSGSFGRTNYLYFSVAVLRMEEKWFIRTQYEVTGLPGKKKASVRGRRKTKQKDEMPRGSEEILINVLCRGLVSLSSELTVCSSET